MTAMVSGYGPSVATMLARQLSMAFVEQMTVRIFTLYSEREQLLPSVVPNRMIAACLTPNFCCA